MGAPCFFFAARDLPLPSFWFPVSFSSVCKIAKENRTEEREHITKKGEREKSHLFLSQARRARSSFSSSLLKNSAPRRGPRRRPAGLCRDGHLLVALVVVVVLEEVPLPDAVLLPGVGGRPPLRPAGAVVAAASSSSAAAAASAAAACCFSYFDSRRIKHELEKNRSRREIKKDPPRCCNRKKTRGEVGNEKKRTHLLLLRRRRRKSRRRRRSRGSSRGRAARR